MPTLWAISEDLTALEQTIQELGGDITDADVEAEIDRWFETIYENRDLKVDNYCALIKELEARSAVRKAAAKEAYDEYQRAMQLSLRDKNEATRLKGRLIEFFERHKMKALETRRFRPAIQANGGPLPLYVSCPNADLPDDFAIIKREPDNDAIRAALDSGEDLPFAVYGERGVHLRIR